MAALRSLCSLRLMSALPISRRQAKERRDGNLARGLFAAALVFTFTVGLHRAEACGPDFPNWLLAGGDGAVLVAPEGNFAAELSRMNLGQPREQAVPPALEGAYAAQSIDAELADLRAALTAAGVAAPEADRVCREHRLERQKLAGFIEAHTEWDGVREEDLRWRNDSGQPQPQSEQSNPEPAFPSLEIVSGLPTEFVDYFEGFAAWHNPGVPDKQIARDDWERVLELPPAQRHYKSTWAAFMLGKSWQKEAPDKAVLYFRQVRELARQGYADALGLAAASLGLEAQVYLNQSNYEDAIEMYLEQMASGDPTATNSLAFAAEKALASGPDTLRALTLNPRTQKVITAYLISRPEYDADYGTSAFEEDNPPPTDRPVTKWLRAAEAAGVSDMDSAEALALAAYRANDMEAAQRWINRSAKSPVTEWLQAKLLLRAGKLQAAAQLLAKVAPLFPIIHEGTNAPPPTDRKDTLSVPQGPDGDLERIPAERQVHGELGVLQLSRGEYVQALNSLLNAGFWMDAAYIAERVLTLDELKNYVDRFWPPVPSEQAATEPATDDEGFWGDDVRPSVLRENIRYLLARRLARKGRFDEARPYYPPEWLSALGRLTASLSAWSDQALPQAERAHALFAAAMITRTNGMELMGTEVAPDWHWCDGMYDDGVTDQDRASNSIAMVVHASVDELRRYAQHAPNPEKRFHYRYQAAALCWAAANLLPDNDDRTAYILWQGGTFIKYSDPKFADIFYKALVRRNRHTALGAAADRQRWFPIIDENGNILPRTAKSTER